jgi:hypothetical protein
MKSKLFGCAVLLAAMMGAGLQGPEKTSGAEQKGPCEGHGKTVKCPAPCKATIVIFVEGPDKSVNPNNTQLTAKGARNENGVVNASCFAQCAFASQASDANCDDPLPGPSAD